jgi:hypothetical protein
MLGKRGGTLAELVLFCLSFVVGGKKLLKFLSRGSPALLDTSTSDAASCEAALEKVSFLCRRLAFRPEVVQGASQCSSLKFLAKYPRYGLTATPENMDDTAKQHCRRSFLPSKSIGPYLTTLW